MGGPGSGERWKKKAAVEDCPRIDVRELRGIQPGNRLIVNYMSRGQQLVQEVFFDWSDCNFGGQRPWFLCGDCGRRVAVIYAKGKDFACRHCKSLTYRSCQESDSRFRKLLLNYDGLDGVENFPLYALKRFLSRTQKERKKLIKQLDRRPRGRPPKMSDGALEDRKYQT
jgi:hypothetical protein